MNAGENMNASINIKYQKPRQKKASNPAKASPTHAPAHEAPRRPWSRSYYELEYIFEDEALRRSWDAMQEARGWR